MKNNHVLIAKYPAPNATKWRDDAAARIDEAIKAARYDFYLQPERCAAFDSLIGTVRARTLLLRPTSSAGRAGWAAPIFLIKRLRNLAERRGHWIRPCHDWQPNGTALRHEFRSLAMHLLALYPLPGFMDAVWDQEPGPEGFRQQSWYIRLARGASFRDLNLPLLLTRRMEHYARLAPHHYTVTQALRFGETLGLGGSLRLACRIADSQLGQRLEHGHFWRTIILFFVNHPGMDLALVTSIIDFIQSNKFAGEPIVTAHGTVLRRPSWPDFSIKGRTPASMLRLVQEWNADLSGGSSRGDFSWPASNINGFRFVEDSDNGKANTRAEWSIHELVSSAELYLEGRALRHCLHTYAPRCRRGESTIWSLRLTTDGQVKRVATIEVNPRKGEVVQTRAKANGYAGPRAREIIRGWARAAGLRLNPRSW